MFDIPVVDTPVKSAFSAVWYSVGYCTHTFEWRWSKKAGEQWCRASKDGYDGTYEDGLLRPQDADALLDAFGLLMYQDAPAYEVLIGMSPAMLIQLRRKREFEENLLFFQVLNERGHARNPAEYYH